MILVAGILTCATEAEADTVRRHLPQHIALSLAEPGCLTFNIEPTADPLVWQLDESFVSRAAFEAHQTRTRASIWYAATAHLARDFAMTEV
jgi:quinol monooxygenase YgiN